MGGGAQQGGGEGVQGVAAALDGFDDLFELVLEGGFAGAVAGEAGGGRAAGGGGEGSADRAGQREGGVGGEDGGEADALDGVAVFAQADGAVVGVRAGEAGGDGVQCGFVAFQAADIGADAGGTAGEGGVAQGADGFFKLVEGEVVGIHAPGDGEGGGEDGAAERVVVAALPGLLDEGDEVGCEGVIQCPWAAHLRLRRSAAWNGAGVQRIGCDGRVGWSVVGSCMVEADPDRIARRSLARHRAFATGLLVVMAGLILVSYALPPGYATDLLQAAAKAGFVGGVADWREPVKTS